MGIAELADNRMMESRNFVRGGETRWEPAGEGVRRQVLGYGPDLMMVHVEFEQGAVGSIHRHPHRQVTFVAAGTFEVSIDGKREVLREGDSFFVPAGLEHGARALEPGKLIDVFTPAREDFL